MKTEMKIRQKYMEKNGGIDEVFNDLNKKNDYEKFLKLLLNRKTSIKKVKWTQKRNKK